MGYWYRSWGERSEYDRELKIQNGGGDRMAKKVVMIEIIEEDKKGQREVKRLSGEAAEKFIKKTKSAGIRAKWEKAF